MITVQSRDDFITQLSKCVKRDKSILMIEGTGMSSSVFVYSVCVFTCRQLVRRCRGGMALYVHYICALVAASAFCVLGGECIEETASFAGLPASACLCVCLCMSVCDYLSPPALAFAERRSKSFSRSWSDPTPVKPDSPHEPRDSELTQTRTRTKTHTANKRQHAAPKRL